MAGCATAMDTLPKLGFMTPDADGGWLLYTDRSDIPSHTRFRVLSIDGSSHVSCCGEITSPAPASAVQNGFFIDVDSDTSTNQHVFHVKWPKSAMAEAGMAVWNVDSAVPDDTGYALTATEGTKTYTADSCLGSEGINLYLRTGDATASPLKHYYVNLGYAIDGSNCREP